MQNIYKIVLRFKLNTYIIHGYIWNHSRDIKSGKIIMVSQICCYLEDET